MTKKNNNNTTPETPHISKSMRRKIAAENNRKKRKDAPKDSRQIASDVHVYTDDSYIDKRKKVYTHGLKQAKERIAAKTAQFSLPETIDTVRRPLRRLLGLLGFRTDVTSCMIVNRDGKTREFLPDKPGRHAILCHASVARRLVSGVCMLVRITACEDAKGQTIDGSWAIVPAEYRMMRTTTIQHLRLRPWFFLKRYWYEISFDGRVQPAHLFLDYGINPELKKRRFYITREFVKVRQQDATNDYFRFWLKKPQPHKNTSPML